jgi:DnaJ like chaperone protein
MSIWATLAGAAAGLLLGGPLGALAGAAAGGAIDLTIGRAANPERRRVAFTIAAIALAAKMARADGDPSAAEFATFQRLFHVEEGEAANARRFYDLAKQSMSGFEAYADQAATLLGRGTPLLEDLLDALWLIAEVDGFHEAELAYLDTVAGRFGFDAANGAHPRPPHRPRRRRPVEHPRRRTRRRCRRAARSLSWARQAISPRPAPGRRDAGGVHPRL